MGADDTREEKKENTGQRLKTFSEENYGEVGSGLIRSL